jgi:hypothetical protein
MGFDTGTWTPEEVLKDMKDAIQNFGRYSFNDKGPYETMDIHNQAAYLKTLSAQEVHDFIKVIRGNTKLSSDKESVARALIVLIDDGPWSEEEFDFICEASPGSY